MNARTACYMIGNGNIRRGHELLVELALRCKHARAKHPVFAEGPYHALGVIGEEFRELERAVEGESPERQKDEALDVAVTALRLVLGEHDRKSAAL